MAKQTSLTRAFDAAASRAVADLGTWLDQRFREEITSSKWQYPTAPQLRDIVDSGRLRDSQRVTVTPENAIIAEWPVPYATEVHEGGTTLDGRRFPGRPWTRAPLTETGAKFAELLRTSLRAQQ